MLPNSGEDGRLTIRFWSDLFNSSMDFGAQFDFLCVGGDVRICYLAKSVFINFLIAQT
jgi:hypothetical protein